MTRCWEHVTFDKTAWKTTKPLQHSHTYIPISYIPTPTMPFPIQRWELKVPASTGPLCILQMCTPTPNRCMHSQNEQTPTKSQGIQWCSSMETNTAGRKTNPESWSVLCWLSVRPKLCYWAAAVSSVNEQNIKIFSTFPKDWQNWCNLVKHISALPSFRLNIIF